MQKNWILIVALCLCAIPILFPEGGAVIGLLLVVLPVLALTGKIRNSAVGLLTPGKTPSTGLRTAEICVGVLLLFASINLLARKHEKEAAANAKIQAEAAKRAREEEISALQRNLGAVVLECQGRLDAVQADILRADYDSAEKDLRLVESRMLPFFKLSPTPAALESVRSVHAGLAAKVTPVTKAKEAWDGSQQAISKGEELRKGREFSAAQASFVTARDLLTSIEEPGAKTLGLNPSRSLSFVGTKLKLVEKPAEREKAALEKERLKREALAVVCGTKPERSSWDGAIYGLESALKETAHDPKSIEVKDCSLPVLSEKHCWVFRCKVRGKNAFGALILRTPLYSKSNLGFAEVQ